MVWRVWINLMPFGPFVYLFIYLLLNIYISCSFCLCCLVFFLYSLCTHCVIFALVCLYIQCLIKLAGGGAYRLYKQYARSRAWGDVMPVAHAHYAPRYFCRWQPFGPVVPLAVDWPVNGAHGNMNIAAYIKHHISNTISFSTTVGLNMCSAALAA